jgi:hypothetical protein
MFFEKVIYPEYSPLMETIQREAKILMTYMKEEYDMTLIIDKRGLLQFPVKERWLKGEEYAFILRHYKTYTKMEGFNINMKQQD